NQTVTLPELPKAKGYQNVGWTTAKGKTTPVYKAGSKVKVTKNMKFYTVRRKSNYYNVEFFYGNGKSNSAYKKLKKRVEEGTEIK
ncbi:InlB B-repeat-containing protein, partial [Acinetobacter baumannii]|nr:InlB B-repeat-containing protein [Acinetobacter baumannii]